MKKLNPRHRAKVVPYEINGVELIEDQKAPFQSVIFHYQSFTENWFCVPRDNYVEYFNGNHKNCGTGKTLIEAYRNLSFKR